MRRVSQRLAEQTFGRSGIAPREHEVDRGSGEIDDTVEVAPATLDTNVGLIDTPGLVSWREMTAQPLLQFGNESEYRKYQRPAQRISSGSVCRHVKIAGRIAFFMISSGYQPPSPKVATQPLKGGYDVPTDGRHSQAPAARRRDWRI